ncbi:M15 family peptidase [Prevotella sp. OH937_COT-195]|nr:M15 family peptidase [Prevotella sp. OH937_COT-195]
MVATLVIASVFAVGFGCNERKTGVEIPGTVTGNTVDSKVGKTNVKESTGIPPGAMALIEAYPDFIEGYRDNKIVFKDGSEMIYDDGREKSFEQKLDDADIEDMFSFRYEMDTWIPGFQQDAGRSRNEALFKKMYGKSAAEVRKHLVKVPWFGQNVLFTTVNGAAEHLKAVRDELAKHPGLKAYFKSEGSFYWRQVRGAKRQSAHSYGMTIDIGGSYKTYWLWAKSGARETDKIPYKNKMPHEIVEIFEKHGFIWGGRWYHYDTMHFEYRPEILLMEKYRRNRDK